MGFGSPPGFGGSPKQYADMGGSLSVGDMGGWMQDDGGGFADASGFYGDSVVIDDASFMMGDQQAPISLGGSPAQSLGGRLSMDAMPQGSFGGMGMGSPRGMMPGLDEPSPLMPGPVSGAAAGLAPSTSLRGSPLATSENVISGSPLARFAGTNIQPVAITREAAAPVAATKPAVIRRKPAARDTSDNGRVSKKPWNDDEDALVIKLVHEHGAKNWPLIADHLPGRVGKQCRERCANVQCRPLRRSTPTASLCADVVVGNSRRWLNHLNPSVKKGPWAIEEEETLIHGHRCVHRLLRAKVYDAVS